MGEYAGGGRGPRDSAEIAATALAAVNMES